ncbi:MAG: hypothetical protein U5R49_21975 [Deltaproteobacteria bacterium]|nr:hypothetical protein [Deltaproteobacteria bacterium]
MLEKYHSDISDFQPVFVNVVKKIINLLVQVYLEDAERQVIDGTAKDEKIYQDIIDETNLNLKMKLTSRYAKLLKTVLLRPVWRKGALDLDLLTPDILDVEWDETPEQLSKIMITLYPANGKYKEIEYSLWTPETYQRLDYKGNIIETEQNPYGVLPFVPVWDSYPGTGSFWLPGGDDIILAQEAINKRLVDLMLVLEMQGFGIPVGKLLTDSGKLEIGPRSVVEINNPDGEFSFQKSNAPIQQIINAIQFLISQLAITNGLSAEVLSVKPTQQSGIARLASNVELQTLQKEQRSLFARYEKQLFNMMKIVWNTHNATNKISEKARLKLDLYDSRPVMAPDKQAELWKAELDMGITSRTDLLIYKNPDLSRKDAKRKLKEIDEENKQFNLSPNQGVKPEE